MLQSLFLPDVDERRYQKHFHGLAGSPINTNPLANEEGITIDIGVDRVEEVISEMELLLKAKARVSTRHTHH